MTNTNPKSKVGFPERPIASTVDSAASLPAPINWKHVEALFLRAPVLLVSESGGLRLVSDGHILVPAAFTPVGDQKTKEQPRAKLLWESSLTVPVKPAKIGGLVRTAKGFPRIHRRIGDGWVGEQYFRCFTGAAWTPTGDQTKPLLVHGNGVLSGIVMGTLLKDEPRDAICVEPTDAEVFGPLACAENDWYLMDEGAIRSRIDKTRDELDEAQRKFDSAHEELADLRARLKVLETTQRRDREAQPSHSISKEAGL